MPSGNIYRQGRDFEYRVAANYRKRGWVVIRSAGSHSPLDLVCAKGGEIRLVQCKAGERGLSSIECERLVVVANEFGGTAWVVSKDKARHIKCELIT